MDITIVKHEKTLTEASADQLRNALREIQFDYIGTAVRRAYEMNKEYEFINTIGTVKVTFKLEDLK